MRAGSVIVMRPSGCCLVETDQLSEADPQQTAGQKRRPDFDRVIQEVKATAIQPGRGEVREQQRNAKERRHLKQCRPRSMVTRALLLLCLTLSVAACKNAPARAGHSGPVNPSRRV